MLSFPGIVPIWRRRRGTMPQLPGRHETTRDRKMNASDQPQQPGATELEATRLRGLSEADRTLLVVDDDAPLCQRLARAMERRGFVVSAADRARWEHIQRIFELCDRNVSETARRLKMHRRTLQRILSKHAPRS